MKLKDSGILLCFFCVCVCSCLETVTFHKIAPHKLSFTEHLLCARHCHPHNNTLQSNASLHVYRSDMPTVIPLPEWGLRLLPGVIQGEEEGGEG